MVSFTVFAVNSLADSAELSCRENPRQSSILLVPDRPRFCRLIKTRIPDHLGWSGTNRENRERFYFPDASQISAMIDDFPDVSAKTGTVGKQQNPRSFAIFPT